MSKTSNKFIETDPSMIRFVDSEKEEKKKAPMPRPKLPKKEKKKP